MLNTGGFWQSLGYVPGIAKHWVLNLRRSTNPYYDIIMDYVKKQQGGVIFLDASGGTGKTFLINGILAEIRANKEIALALASSGIAATLMDGGRTAHSALKLPLNVAQHEFSVRDVTGSSARGQILKQCEAIIWDECTMAHRKSFEAPNKTLQDLRVNASLMGGALLILSGDFLQTLPVIPRSTPADEINACLKHSDIWTHVKQQIGERESRETKELQVFVEKLLQIREGIYPVDNIPVKSY